MPTLRLQQHFLLGQLEDADVCLVRSAVRVDEAGARVHGTLAGEDEAWSRNGTFGGPETTDSKRALMALSHEQAYDVPRRGTTQAGAEHRRAVRTCRDHAQERRCRAWVGLEGT